MKCASPWLLALFLFAKPSHSWVVQKHHATSSLSSPLQQCNHPRLTSQQLYSSTPPLTSSLGTNEAAWKQEGERIIMKAATEAGANPEMIAIDWKAGRLVVTVDGAAYIPAAVDKTQSTTAMEDEDEDDERMEEDDELMEDDEVMMEDNELLDSEDFEDDEGDDFIPDGFTEEDSENDDESMGANVVSIGRAVNRAFDEEGEGSIGYNIAVHHSIEVTTPGATDELFGIMFDSYKGFGVILEFRDSKTNKTKKIEGNLIERNDEFTQINEKGRMRKFKNDLVVRVTLPKAKVEKGVQGKKTKKPKKKRK